MVTGRETLERAGEGCESKRGFLCARGPVGIDLCAPFSCFSILKDGIGGGECESR